MTRSIVAISMVAMFVTLAGCKSDKDKAAGSQPRMSEGEVMNRSKLEAYPDMVEAAFIRDYPTGNVTDVDVYNDHAGRTMYEVNFVRDGRAEDAVYTAEGTRVTMPSNRTTTSDGAPANTTPPPPR